MSISAFTELPINYQQGCLAIEKRCKKALKAAKLSADSIAWDGLNLMTCYLIIHAYHQRFEIKFGKLAILNPDDKNTQTIITCKLQFLIDALHRAKRRSDIK